MSEVSLYLRVRSFSFDTTPSSSAGLSRFCAVSSAADSPAFEEGIV